MTTTTSTTPTCQCCPRRLLEVEVQDSRLVCRPCEARIAAELGEVVELWPRLPALLAPGAAGSDGGSSRAPGPTGSKPPANLAVLSLLGGGVTDLLLVEEDAWRREIQKTRRYPNTPKRGRQDAILAGTVEWLRQNLFWACHAYPDVDDLDRALRKLLGEMRGLVSGDRRRREDLKPGCPMPAHGYAEDDSRAPACGGQLTYDPRQTLVRCGSCRRAYGKNDWHRVGLAAGLITLPVSAAA